MLSRALSAARPAGRRTLATTATLPELAYDYAALEPVVSSTIMEIHHSKHHATYVNNLNAALESADKATQAGDASALIALAPAIKFNGGGHINHTLFWENLCAPGSSAAPSGDLLKAIEASFGSVDNMKATMSAQTIAVQGSGWGWLGYNATSGLLEIATCSNQDPLKATTGLHPLVGIDVWEHAYYLDYKNVRPDYVKAIWDCVNWDCAAERLKAAQA